MWRNLPVAVIGLLKLEEKDIVARQAKGRQGTRTDLCATTFPPNLGECSEVDKHDGETLEQLAADIPIGRVNLDHREPVRAAQLEQVRPQRGRPTA